MSANDQIFMDVPSVILTSTAPDGPLIAIPLQFTATLDEVKGFSTSGIRSNDLASFSHSEEATFDVDNARLAKIFRQVWETNNSDQSRDSNALLAPHSPSVISCQFL